MSYRFVTCDVFTDRMFGGNQLAVLPDARGLSTEQMAAIAREFNYSETTFVLPPNDSRNTRHVRIFTPGGEIPFAGHPTVGTAHVLAAIGEIPLTGDETKIVFEEGVGPVAVLIRSQNGKPTFAQLTAAKPADIAPAPATIQTLADVLSLDTKDFLDGDYAPQVVSYGLPFCFVPVRDRGAVARARVKLELWEKTLQGKLGEMLFVFAPEGERAGSDIHSRMFGPSVGVIEDPATGSACTALGAYLGARTPRQGTLRWVVEQGFEMGRPSILEIEVEKSDGNVASVRVGGESVMVSEGSIEVP
jgi:trans-2,3-dihydro-3-hydroxyanthranilate isomerase